MYLKLADLLRHGVRLMDALEDLQKRERRKGIRSPGYVVISRCRRRIQAGNHLADAFGDFIPYQERLLIEAGRKNNRIPESLKMAARTVQQGREIKTAVLRGVAYPCLILGAMIGLVYFVGTSLVPQIARMGDPSTWSGAPRHLFLVSQFVQSTWALLIPIGLLCAGGGIAYSLPRTQGTGTIRVLLDRIPPWSLYRMVVGSNVLLSLSALLRSGTPLQPALYALRRQASPWLKQRLDATLAALRAGATNLGEAFERAEYEFPDREIIDDLKTFASLPDLEDVLHRYGEEWMKQGVDKVKRQTQILNRVSILVLAMLLAWVAWGMFGIQQELATNLVF